MSLVTWVKTTEIQRNRNIEILIPFCIFYSLGMGTSSTTEQLVPKHLEKFFK